MMNDWVQLSKRIVWPRVLLEVVVIVVSILLAFGIQAWWDARVLRDEERELLAVVLEGVEASRDAISGLVRTIETDQSALKRFYALGDEDLAKIPRDSLRVFQRGLARPATEGLSLGPLAGIVNSGQVALIRDPGIRASLDEWLRSVAGLEEIGRNSAAAELRSLEAMTRHPVIQDQYLGDPNENVFLDLRAPQEDEVLRAAAATVALQRNITLNVLPRRLEILDRIATQVANYRP